LEKLQSRAVTRQTTLFVFYRIRHRQPYIPRHAIERHGGEVGEFGAAALVGEALQGTGEDAGYHHSDNAGQGDDHDQFDQGEAAFGALAGAGLLVVRRCAGGTAREQVRSHISLCEG